MFQKSIKWLFLLLACLSCGLAQAEINEHPKNSMERTCISLTTLERHLRNGDISDTAFSLAGIGWFEAAIVDKGQRDVILCGRTAQHWPHLTLDDFVVNLKNVMLDEHYPYCSLDPAPKNIKKLNTVMSQKVDISNPENLNEWLMRIKQSVGPQEVVVGGIPKDSNHAFVMIAADYHMKKLSQGHVTIDNIPSLLDISIADMMEEIQQGKDPAMTASMSRFWFHIKDGHPKVSMDSDAVLLEDCDVVVLTEKQRANADGVLSDSNEDDIQATRFAENLSRNFQDAATVVDSYAQLENLYRLHSLIQAIKKTKIADHFFDFSFFLKQYRYRYGYSIKSTLPGLVNAKFKTITKKDARYIQKFKLLPIVAGGVSMEVIFHDSQMNRQSTDTTAILAKDVIRSRPAVDTLYWKVPVH